MGFNATVCLLMICLNFTLLYLKFELKINLLIFRREGSPYLACNDINAFFTSKQPNNIRHGFVQTYMMR